jgi:hypothetical protein
MAWLAEGEPLSPKHLIRSASTVLPFGLCNAVATVSHLVAQRMVPPPTNDEFVGVIEHVAKSFHNLLAEEPESPSGSNSSRGSHHPSRECFMTGTPEGHVESVHEEEATPTNNLDHETERETAAPPRMPVEQLKARHRDIEEARLQLEQECAKLDQDIERRGDGGRARTMARDVNRRIIANDEALPRFARASQNIAIVAALLHGLPEATTPEDRWAHHKIHNLLERAAAQQAESLLSR